MSKEVKKLSLLDQLRVQHSQFIQQKTLAENNLNQLIGAVFACEVMIKKHEQEESQQLLVEAQENVKTNIETEKQVA